MSQSDTIYPSFDQFAVYAKNPTYKRVPLKLELLSDSFTTIELLRRLRAVSDHVFLLESAEADERSGRYSFLGFAPDLEVSCLNGDLQVRYNIEPSVFCDEGQQDESSPQNKTKPSKDSQSKTEHYKVEHPASFLRELIAQNYSATPAGFPPFTGGLVGYFSYDYLKYAEPLLRRDDLGHRDFLDMDLMLFNDLIVFDTYRQKLLLISGARLGKDRSKEALENAYNAAQKQLFGLKKTVSEAPRKVFDSLQLKAELTPRFSKEQFEKMVNIAKYHIHEGDIFQIVLSNPFSAPAQGSLFDTYRILRSSNPSPYMFYFTSNDIEIAGASPETLVRLEKNKLTTFPLAGTRRRGATDEEDKELEEELLSDKKELAEHNMLVDLARNDLGKIAQPGSVRVEKYLDILRFSHVMHLASTVSATLQDEKDALDAVDAILPAGTLSGAPKLKACQIIQELEGAKRGIYGGAVGYLDFSGNLDTCIGIRLAYKKNAVVYAQSGAGIVADSVAPKEYEECQNKLKATLYALLEADGGLCQ